MVKKLSIFNSKLVYRPHKSLITPCKKIDFKNDDINKIKQIVKDLNNEILNVKGIYQGNCLGISANQIGQNLNLFLMSRYPKNDKLKLKKIDVFINPEIKHYSKQKTLKWEGCVSDKEYILLVNRPELITIRYFDLEGKEHETELEQLRSRIAQHEMDHLNGIEIYANQVESKLSLGKLENKFFYDDWYEVELKNGNLF